MLVIPLPNYYQKRLGSFQVNENTSINFSNEFKITANVFLKFIQDKTNIILTHSEISKINFVLNVELSNEGYIIDVTENQLTIHARSDQGAFYAFQTLRQLFYFEENNFLIDSIYIEDEPRFSYRGFMLDVARHFFSKEIVLEIIDYLALHKFNYLHLHLSDDQGFRLASDTFPLLNEISSTREKTKRLGGYYDRRPHFGFYTKEDILEIVEYAKNNFIEVIPEIDIPGHSTAILAAYHNLACNNKKLQVETSFGIKKNSLCMSKSESYNFIFSLLDEVIEIFPNRFIHLGGDEIKFNNYKKCKSCKKVMQDNNLNSYKELFRFFINNIANYLREKGKTPIIWNDYIAYNINYDVINQHWKPLTKKKTINEINLGRKTIISNFFYLYLDYPYSMTPLAKTYNFEPILKGVSEPNNILGIEATLWTEWITNKKRLEHHLFPRLAAVSEVAWTNPINKNYDNFVMRLKNLTKLYDEYYLNYDLSTIKQKFLLKRFIDTYSWYKGKK